MGEDSKSVWRKFVREGKLVYIGYSSPDKSFFEDDDQLGQVMVEVFLDRKYTGDKKSRKIKISLEVLD
jgi:hypothetical protein